MTLQIRQLSLSLSGTPLLDGLDISIQPGEVFTLMGRSGCGKSTVLNWLIGALPDTFSVSGEAWLDGRRIDQLPTEQRQTGILFQDDLLFPHLSVGGNLAFALPARYQGKALRREKIEAALHEAGLAGFYVRDPATLSGGQRARVSVLRALLAEPKALLLDEPFSRLDSELRGQFREFVYAQIAARGIPALLVTHDREDVPGGGEVMIMRN